MMKNRNTGQPVSTGTHDNLIWLGILVDKAIEIFEKEMMDDINS